MLLPHTRIGPHPWSRTTFLRGISAAPSAVWLDGGGWTREGTILRPLACRASVLPLTYASVVTAAALASALPGFSRMLCHLSSTVLEPAQGAAPAASGTSQDAALAASARLERVTGTAPASSAWKAGALLLSYTRTEWGLLCRTSTGRLEGCPGVEPGISWVATTCIADLPTARGSCWSGWGESNTLRPAPKAGASPSGTIQVKRRPPRGTIPALCA